MNDIDMQHLDIERLERASRVFFSTYGTSRLLGHKFIEQLGRKPGQNLFDCLMETCGYQKDSEAFFNCIFSNIKSSKNKPAFINGIELPRLYLYHLLETGFPGHRLHAVKTTRQLEEKAFVSIRNPAKLQAVMDMFPVRLSDHVIRQSLVSEAVAKQYLPFEQELDDRGHTITFDGHFKNGVVEQMYQNRVIFLLDMHCPVYCRFCFRKHKSKRKEKTPDTKDVMAAIDHVRSHPSIHEILITGGEPLWNKANMDTAINGLMEIDHINAIRIATRSIVYYPELFLKDDSRYIRYLIEKNFQSQKFGKRIEIGIHVVHPEEVSIQSLDIISRLVKNGIQVYVQTPFLEGVNTNGKTLGNLFALLRQAGAQIYYIFTPCSPIHGTKAYWSPIKHAFEAQRYLRKHLSDRLVPKLCTATPLGKIEWHTSGWAVDKDLENPEYTWIRTPYTLEYFKQFIQDLEHMPELRVNDEGTLDAKFRLDMGDDVFLSGVRSRAEQSKNQKDSTEPVEEIKAVLSLLYDEAGLGASISQVPSAYMSRVHKTRLEIKLTHDHTQLELDRCIQYISQNRDITDVVVLWENDPALSIRQVERLAKRLKEMSHIVCVRLRSAVLSTHPETFSKKIIETLSKCSDFSVGNPFRVEMETWFLVADQITDAHKQIAAKFINCGVNVYANSALITGINDSPEKIAALAHALRKAKIEFHHLYAAGLAVQKKCGCRLDVRTVIDIASEVRAQCSGRQIPLYMLQTPKGDIDFGLDPFFIPFLP